MRIGVDARVLTLPEVRGIANYVLEVLKYWPSCNDEFILFYETGPLHSVIETQAKITSVHVPEPIGTRFKVWHWLAMPQTLKKYPVDVLWCPANIPIPFKGCKQVLTVHDTLLQEPFRKHSFFNNFFYRVVVPFWARNYVDKTITVSSFSKERIQKLLKLEPQMIQIVYNGLPSVTTTFLTKKDAQQRLADTGIVSGRYIYALGAESFWKNTELLLRSFAYVQQHCSNLNLVISGIQESAMNRYKTLSSNLGLNSSLILLRFIDASTRNALYQGAEAFVYPSLFEGFGFPPLEAMALGCPVIASDRASIPEVVGKAALMVNCASDRDIANSILDLVDDEKKKFELVEAGYRNILRFRWQESAVAHHNLFEKRML